jgi:hypothetical protein
MLYLVLKCVYNNKVRFKTRERKIKIIDWVFIDLTTCSKPAPFKLIIERILNDFI